MCRPPPLALPCLVLVAALIPIPAIAHDPLLDLPEPQSVPEAWNVLTESARNVDQLMETGQLKEVVYQVANCSPPLRLLAKQTHDGTRKPGDRRRRTGQFQQEIKACFDTGVELILATRETKDASAKSRPPHARWRESLKALEAHYPHEVVRAQIYVCPMHPLDRHLDPDERCGTMSHGPDPPDAFRPVSFITSPANLQ